MKPYRVFSDITHADFKRVLAWVKRYKKFGVYCEADQYLDLWQVRVYCPPIHTDMLGNSAIKP